MVSRLLGLFYALDFLLSCRAGVVPCCMSVFADCTFRHEPRNVLSGAFLRFMSSCAVAACLRGTTLSTDVAVVVAPEALLNSA